MTTSSWFSLFTTATALHDYEPEDSLELCFKAKQTIHIAGQRNNDWFIGTVVTENSEEIRWGLFPASFVTINKANTTSLTHSDKKQGSSPPETKSSTDTTTTTTTSAHTTITTDIPTATARRELHEYYFRHHRDKIHKLDGLLLSYSGNYLSLYHGLLEQFGTSPATLSHQDVVLQAPRQASMEEHSVQLTWSTREMYDCLPEDGASVDRHGQNHCVMALKYQDVLISSSSSTSTSTSSPTSSSASSSSSTTDDWTIIVPSEALRVQLDRTTGTTRVWLTGLFPGVGYRCSLALYDIHDHLELPCKRASVGYFKTKKRVVEEQETTKQHRRPTSMKHVPSAPVLTLRKAPPAIPARKSRQYLPIPTGRKSSTTRTSTVKVPPSRPPTRPPRRASTTTTATATAAATTGSAPETTIEPAASLSSSDDEVPQPPVRPLRPPSRSEGASPTNASKKAAKLLYMGFRELLETEQKYVNDMTFIVNALVRPLQQRDGTTPDVSPTALRSIFGNLEQTVGVNRTFLSDLRVIQSRSSSTCSSSSNSSSNSSSSSVLVSEQMTLQEMETVWSQVANIIIQTWPFFRAYKTYSTGHGTRDMKHIYATIKGLKTWIQDVLSGSIVTCPSATAKTIAALCTSLESELIKPIQRILKYSLFVRDATKQIQSTDIKGQMESAMSAVDSISSEVNASLAKNERDKKMVGLWNKLGKQPSDFLQPGRSLLNVMVAEVAPAMEGSKKGYSWGKRKEYLVCVLSDIVLFARPNKAGIFGYGRERVELDGSDGNMDATHHVKMIAKMTDLKVTETYAMTQAKGGSGFELRVLGTISAKDMENGFSPYRAYAIWCENTKEKEKLSSSINDALKAKLAAFFSRKKVKPPGGA